MEIERKPIKTDPKPNPKQTRYKQSTGHIYKGMTYI